MRLERGQWVRTVTVEVPSQVTGKGLLSVGLPGPSVAPTPPSGLASL